MLYQFCLIAYLIKYLWTVCGGDTIRNIEKGFSMIYINFNTLFTNPIATFINIFLLCFLVV